MAEGPITFLALGTIVSAFTSLHFSENHLRCLKKLNCICCAASKEVVLRKELLSSFTCRLINFCDVLNLLTWLMVSAGIF